MHQVRLSDDTYDAILAQAALLGVSIEEALESHFASLGVGRARSLKTLIAAGKRSAPFSTKKEISSHLRALRDEWDR